MQRIAKWIATCGGVGYFPAAPGTAASVIGVFFYLFWGHNPALFLGLTLMITTISFLVTPHAEAFFGTKDDGRIVIDEVAGQMVGLLFLPVGIAWAIWGFVLFRIFDCFKPPPLRFIENRWGPPGVTADDIGAGLYTLAFLQIVSRL